MTLQELHDETARLLKAGCLPEMVVTAYGSEVTNLRDANPFLIHRLRPLGGTWEHSSALVLT